MTTDTSALISKVVERAAEKYREQSGQSLVLPVGIDPAVHGEALLVESLAAQLLSFFGITGQPGSSATHQVPENAPDQTAATDLLERNRIVARALGACECWGELPDCRVCSGEGNSGWSLPHKPLFDRIVRPALQTINAHRLTVKRNGTR